MKKLKYSLVMLLSIACLASCGSNAENNNRTVYLFYGDNIMRQETVKIGDDYTAPTDIVTEAYNFDGWFLNPAYSSIMKASFPMRIHDDVYLFAKYQIKKFIVTYDLNDPEAQMTSITTILSYGQKMTYIDPSMYLPTKTFSGWYKEEECINLFNFNSPVFSATTIYAKWVD